VGKVFVKLSTSIIANISLLAEKPLVTTTLQYQKMGHRQHTCAPLKVFINSLLLRYGRAEYIDKTTNYQANG
jgi:hypothetical protein